MSRIKLFKLIDHWLGLPLCLFFGILNFLFCGFGKKYPRVDPARIKRILVIKFFGLGSIILILSLLKALKARYPDSQMDFLTFQSNRDFIQREGICDNIIYVNDKGFFNFLYSTLAAVLYLMFKRYNVSVDLEYYAKYSTLFSFFSGARYKTAFYLPSFWRKLFVNIPVHLNFSRHILKVYEYIGAALDIDGTLKRYMISPKQQEKIDNFIKNNLSGRRILGVNVNASEIALCRRLALGTIAGIIKKVLSKYADFSVVLLGSVQERSYVELLLRDLSINNDFAGRVLNSAGMFSMEELFYFLKKMAMCLSVDSGILHFCYSLEVPTVSIWGPGSPVTHGPYSDKEGGIHKVIYENWCCSPCLYIYNTEPAYFCDSRSDCLKGITAEQVFSQIDNLLLQEQ